jgi:hypothetical protein
MDSMQQMLMVRVPEPLRAIFAEWAVTCDPAPLCRGGADPHDASEVYGLLAMAAADTALARQSLARVYADARLNMEFGQFAELRREGAQVLPWITRVLAADPVLSAQLAQQE